LRLRSGFLASLSSLALGGCLYGFAGGGLPSHIKTVAVLPFDNQTPEPTLTQEINTAVREAVEGRLGLRQASERQADAVVRGTITRYEPDVPVAFTGDAEGEGAVTVTRRLVQISVSVEILDQANNKPLWQRSGLLLEGDYDPGREADGREKALDKLVTNIVEGAQSQW
jgi:Lipopolysaccharide-assembly